MLRIIGHLNGKIWNIGWFLDFSINNNNKIKKKRKKIITNTSGIGRCVVYDTTHMAMRYTGSKNS
jgi:hypothetical protein